MEEPAEPAGELPPPDASGSARRSEWRGDPAPAGTGATTSELLELLAGLEADRLARGDGDLDAGLRVAPDALLAVAHLEHAEAAQLDALAGGQRLFHGVDDGVHRHRRLDARHGGVLSDEVDDVGLDHACSEGVRRD